MNNIKKSLISILVCSIILSLWGQPVFAEEYYNTTGYFDRLLLGIVHGTSSIPLVGDAVQGIAGGLVGDICSGSDDGLHHATEFVDGTLHQKDGLNYALGICLYCGKRFEIYGADVKTAYNDYVETLPAPSYTSDGSITWSPKIEYWGVVGDSKLVMARCPHVPDSVWSPEDSRQITSFSCSDYSVSVRPALGVEQIRLYVPKVHIKDIYPIDGYYERLQTPFSVGSFIDFRSETKPYNIAYFRASSELKYAGNTIEYDYYPDYSSYNALFYSIQVYSPVYKVTPFNPSGVSNAYNINTRPTSITGGNYGIVGDNGQITKVEDNSTIINETNNTFYNPATGTTVPIVNWSYDYSDRSYKVTLESGDTATITYGDENITISQITTTEGDTITNNYTIYYLVDGSGSENPPSTCIHDWQETNTTPATCTIPGSKLSTCSKCQQTKKDPFPALGHDWQVKQTVTTEYDDTGQLTQEGYTIFECSRCHEQYKSPDGTIPPGGGSGTDPGGEEEETIWDKLGKLLGTAVKALLDLLGSAVDVILGGLIDLITNLVESLKQLVDLFGTVGEAFQVLWTWLPPEITAILVAGVSIFVFVALLKFFMK